jgi:site-specific DNA-methyltransferase (adenine-specific)
VLSAVRPKANVLITDPPYRSLDIDVVRGTRTRLIGGHNPRAGNRIGSAASGWFETLSDEDIEGIIVGRCIRWLPDDGAAYVFADVKTGLRLFPKLAYSNVIVWDKMKLGMGYSWRRMHEWVAYCPGPKHKLRSMSLGDIIRCAGVDEKAHPTEKPIGVITPLILNSTDVGGLVLDPFAGVGATLLAARMAGRKAIGIELDEAYCEIAANRLSQGVLFGAPT